MYSREELKNLITELEIIRYGGQTTVLRKKISVELLEQIKNSTSECRDDISERVYWIINDIFSYPECNECGKIFISRYYGIKMGYKNSKSCSKECVNNFMRNEEDRARVIFEKELEDNSSEIIYTREELKEIILSRNIIHQGKQTSVSKNRISNKLLVQIKLSTPNCRDKISERIYWILNDIHDYIGCLECGKNFSPRYFGLNASYSSFCSLSCMAKSSIILKKKSETYLDRTGYSHPSKNPEVIKQKEQTYFDKTGYTNWMVNPQALLESQEKHLKEHGVRFCAQRDDVKETIRQSNIKNWGVSCTLSSPIIIEKGRQTHFKRTGVYNCSQNPTVSEKQLTECYKHKKLVLENGETRIYQGYENVAILKLLEIFSFEEVISDRIDVPGIWYFSKGKRHRYFPDIFLVPENKIIEVKSWYTYEKQLDVNLLKGKACVEAGFKYEFWICSETEILEIISL